MMAGNAVWAAGCSRGQVSIEALACFLVLMAMFGILIASLSEYKAGIETHGKTIHGKLNAMQAEEENALCLGTPGFRDCGKEVVFYGNGTFRKEGGKYVEVAFWEAEKGEPV
ncbi:MAG: hypothetical protein ACP5NX_03380 [Candidatus Bilamarchaeaceae archaeon]